MNSSSQSNPVEAKYPAALALAAARFRPARRDYQRWRTGKLRGVERAPEAVELADPARLLRSESRRLVDELSRHNFVVYRTAAQVDGDSILRFAAALGLHDLDTTPYGDSGGVTALRAESSQRGREFIPYSNRPLNWHTDGYYYPIAQRVCAFILHCLSPAAEGGVNRFLDHELAYLQLRDQEPAWIEALSSVAALTIPAHEVDGSVRRPAVTGPVFSTTPAGRLHMRYTARERSVHWRGVAVLDEARDALHRILDDANGFVRRVALSAGEGVVCANTLHNRSAFVDRGHSTRVLLRARFHDAVTVIRQ